MNGDGIGNAIVDDEKQEQIDRIACGGIGAADEKEAGELHGLSSWRARPRRVGVRALAKSARDA
jgi:hypothetical protein